MSVQAAGAPVTKHEYSTDDQPVEASIKKKKKRGRKVAGAAARGFAEGVGDTVGEVIWKALFGN